MNPIMDATIEVTDAAFWNWLADESNIDLDGLVLDGVDNNRTTGAVRFHVKRPAPSTPRAIPRGRTDA